MRVDVGGRDNGPMPNSQGLLIGPALEPLRVPLFRRLWLAGLVSNFGTLIQGVGAAWLMTQLVSASDMVAFVQAATALPVMLLSVPAGAIADISDRRHVMLAALLIMAVVSIAITALAFLHLVTPWILLGLTFLLGCGSALYGPAWQASVGEQVPIRMLPAAVALNALGYNVARTLGPALGGVIVASSGAPAAFLVNTCSYAALVVVVVGWRRTLLPTSLPPESIGAAIATGLRYAHLSKPISTVLQRAAAFGFGAGALWATLPLVARDLLGGGPLTFGTLLGGFGAGAVVAAFVSTGLRRQYGYNRIASVAGVSFALATTASALSSSLAATLFASALAGASWVLSFSTFNVVVQMSSPRWVVGRTLALYQTAAFGGAAIGAWAWGVTAERIGLTQSLLAASVVLATTSLWLGRRRALSIQVIEDLAPAPMANGGPSLAVPASVGPIIISVEYRIKAEDVPEFLRSAHELGRTRRRDGARRWSMMQDLDDPTRFVERYQALTWMDHLRQWQRATAADQGIRDRVLALHQGSQPPVVRHLWVREPDEFDPLCGTRPD